MPNTSDIRIRSVRPLLSPAILEDELPLDDAGSAAVQRARREVARVILGQDDRLLAVVGPCSVHDPEAALAYAHKLHLAAVPRDSALKQTLAYARKLRVTEN